MKADAMTAPMTLANHLADWAAADSSRIDIARTVTALAKAGHAIAELVTLSPLIGEMAQVLRENSGGDVQKRLDLLTHQIVVQYLRETPVAIVGSEEADEPLLLNSAAPHAVAVDPLDGSSNIDTNVSIGTIFSILPMLDERPAAASLLQPGSRQLAAGFFIYGPQTALVLTLGRGTDIFVLDRRSGAFIRTDAAILIPHATSEFAINASNERHWPLPVRTYIEDCLAGTDGPRGKDFNMRWIASLVADAFRILQRGGIYLYPADTRQGYRDGRLRLVYEANPIAFLLEQGGGAATDGQHRILDRVPGHLHQRTPLVCGSRDEVDRVAQLYAIPDHLADRPPLFGRRGLLRA
jgi:fructose-1,6-bisphosphatase I